MIARLRRRLRAEGGFGLVELLIALTVLSIGVFAIVGAYTSSTAALVRSARVSTASALADARLELYRGLTYAEVTLDATAVASTDATYQADTAYTAAPQVTSSCPGVPEECTPSRTVIGPDNGSYRIDTYITLHEPTGSGASRQVKRVTVVVRDAANLAGRPYVRHITTFDALSG